MPIPAVIGAAAALGSTLLNKKFADEANDRAVEQSEKMINQANARQDYLSANAALIHRNALSKAGYNLNADIGFQTPQALQGSAPSMTAGSGNIDFSSVLGALMQDRQLKQQQPLVDAQAKVAAEQAEAQRIENERNRSKDLTIRNETLLSDVLKTGNMTDQQLMDWYGENIRPVQENLGSFEARKLLRAYQSDLYQFDAKDAQNKLKKLVADAQTQSSPVVEALTNMPVQEFERLFAETNDAWASVTLKGKQGEYYDAQAALTRTEDELKSNSSLIPLIQKYIPEGGLRDAVTALVILASSFTGMNLGFKGKTIINREGNSTTNTHTHTHTHNTNISHTGDKVWVKNGK